MVNQQYPQGGLFADERELTVAFKYMKENGKYIIYVYVKHSYILHVVDHYMSS